MFSKADTQENGSTSMAMKNYAQKIVSFLLFHLGRCACLKRKPAFLIVTIPNCSLPSCLIKWFRENRIKLQQQRAKRMAQQQLGGENKNDVGVDGGNDCGQTSLTLHSTASTTLQRCAYSYRNSIFLKFQ